MEKELQDKLDALKSNNNFTREKYNFLDNFSVADHIIDKVLDRVIMDINTKRVL